MENSEHECNRLAEDQRCRAMNDLLHTLSQPLTSLCCQLEVVLSKPRTNQEYRDCLARALEQAETAARLTQQLRELNEGAAEHPAHT
jgi:hypothetical protein